VQLQRRTLVESSHHSGLSQAFFSAVALRVPGGRGGSRFFSGRRRRRDAFFIIGLFPRRVAIFDRVMNCLQVIGEFFFSTLVLGRCKTVLSMIFTFFFSIQHIVRW